MDQIFTFQKIFEKSWEYSKNVFTRKGRVRSPLLFIELYLVNSNSRVDEGVTVAKRRINRLLFVDNLEQRASSEQGL